MRKWNATPSLCFGFVISMLFHQQEYTENEPEEPEEPSEPVEVEKVDDEKTQIDVEEETKPEEEVVEPPLVSNDAIGDLLVRSTFFCMSFLVDFLSSLSHSVSICFCCRV
jgi:hypothetical protein